jgi:SAM-dependent methyltransferase
MLRCPACRGNLELNGDEGFICPHCKLDYPVIDGIPRMLLPEMREAMEKKEEASEVAGRQAATAESFGFEWSHFSEMRKEWEQNFLDYMYPREPGFFRGKRVLDAGCGNGRHAYYAARYGAEVWAVDLGTAVEVARRNNAENGSVYVIQSDLYDLPFAAESFDFIYSNGVLHHLPDPEKAFQNLLGYLKPGGEIQIFLYWQPEGQPVKSALLAAVTAMRMLTTRLPHRVVYALSYPAAWAAFALFVWPYRVLRRIPGFTHLAERMPMKQYTLYPLRVCVNDQFDRFSAPIENRYTRAEVESWFERAGLEDINVRPNFGWNGTGKKV